MRINVDTLQLQQKSNEIRVLRNELEKTMEEIERLVVSLNGNWQGEAERAYASQIIYVKKQFSNIAVFFDDYATTLEGFAVGYDTLESQLSSKINLT